MNKIHDVEARGLKDTMLELVIDGQTHSIDLKQYSSRLAAATKAQLEDFTISPSGYGIHWPQVDEDLAIDPIIGIEHEIPSWKVAEKSSDYKMKKDKS